MYLFLCIYILYFWKYGGTVWSYIIFTVLFFSVFFWLISNFEHQLTSSRLDRWFRLRDVPTTWDSLWTSFGSLLYAFPVYLYNDLCYFSHFIFCSKTYIGSSHSVNLANLEPYFINFLHCMVSSLIDCRKICVGEMVLCFNVLKLGARPGLIPASTYPHSYAGSIVVWG